MTKSGRDHPNSRVITHLVAEFMLRGAENIGALFAHDYEALILFLAVLIRTTQKVVNDPTLRERFGSYGVPVPDEHLTPVSRLALSRSTGLPRETVRRKVAGLIERGLVIEDRRGGLRVLADLAQNEDYVAILEPQFANLRRLVGLLADFGVLDNR